MFAKCFSFDRYKYFHNNSSNKIYSLVPRLQIRLATRSHFLTVELARCNNKLYSNSFFYHRWNFLPFSWFPTIYELQKCKYNVNHHVRLYFYSTFLSLMFSDFLSLPASSLRRSDNIALLGVKELKIIYCSDENNSFQAGITPHLLGLLSVHIYKLFFLKTVVFQENKHLKSTSCYFSF